MNLKHFKLKKELFVQYEEYARAKLEYVWFKKLIFAILGGVFIGIGYVGTLMIATTTGVSSEISKILSIVGSLLFPVGLLLCIYLGGNLFTSNCMGLISIVYKEKKWKHYFVDLAITFIGNWIGCLLIALVVWGAGLFGTSSVVDHDRAYRVIEIAKQKISASHNHDWWNNMLSGILCNILIVACTMISIITSKKGVGASIIYLILVVFVVSGYQHVVANMYVFSQAGLLSIYSHGAMATFSGAEAGKIFYINIIPTMVGNWIGGAIMSSVYMWASSYVKNNEQIENQIINIDNEAITSFENLSYQERKDIWNKSAKQVKSNSKCSCCHKHKNKLLTWIDDSEICHQCFVGKDEKNGKKGTI